MFHSEEFNQRGPFPSYGVTLPKPLNPLPGLVSCPVCEPHAQASCSRSQIVSLSASSPFFLQSPLLFLGLPGVPRMGCPRPWISPSALIVAPRVPFFHFPGEESEFQGLVLSRS